MVRINIGSMYIEDWLIETSGGCGPQSHRICLAFAMYGHLKCHAFNVSVEKSQQRVSTMEIENGFV